MTLHGWLGIKHQVSIYLSIWFVVIIGVLVDAVKHSSLFISSLFISVHPLFISFHLSLSHLFISIPLSLSAACRLLWRGVWRCAVHLISVHLHLSSSLLISSLFISIHLHSSQLIRCVQASLERGVAVCRGTSHFSSSQFISIFISIHFSSSPFISIHLS